MSVLASYTEVPTFEAELQPTELLGGRVGLHDGPFVRLRPQGHPPGLDRPRPPLALSQDMGGTGAGHGGGLGRLGRFPAKRAMDNQVTTTAQFFFQRIIQKEDSRQRQT